MSQAVGGRAHGLQQEPERRRWLPSKAIPRFGSSRAVLLPATAVAFVCAALVLWQLLIPRPFFTGTNSVGVRSIVAELHRGQRLCVPDLPLPAGTGAVQLALFAQRPHVEAEVRVTAGGRTFASRMTGVPGPTSLAYASAPIPRTASSPASVPATLCISPRDGPIALGGMAELQGNQVPARLDGKPLDNRVSVWFLPPHGQERSLIEEAGAIFQRAALFRPGVIGPWTYPVLLFVIAPLTWVLAIALLLGCLATEQQRDSRGLRRWCARRGALVVGVIAFLTAGSWALITPAFNAPDEPSHFAYAQYLAETGHAPERVPGARPPYSTSEQYALEAVNIYSQEELPDGRPPWLTSVETSWRHRQAARAPAQNNGGGFTEAASPHQPAYYLLLSPFYDLVKSGSAFAQLTVLRLVSALLGAIVAICAFGVVREILPKYPLAAAAAGLLVAFHPMFTFIAGAVNNDNGVNAASAIALYLVVRALRRGLSVWLGIGLALTLVAAPALKESGYEIYLPVLVGLLGVLWRRHALRDLRGVLALVIVFVVARYGWFALQPLFYPKVAGVSEAGKGIVAVNALKLAENMPGRFLVYLWELFLPKLPFMSQLFPPGWPFYHVYVLRGWAAFGWYVWVFPKWVYAVVVVAMGLIGMLAIGTAVRNWSFVRHRFFEIVTVALYPIATLVAVEAVFFAPDGGRTAYAEQGRYIFPAIAALAAIAVAGTFGAGRKRYAPIATTLVVATIGLCYASQLLTLGSFFT